MLILKTLSIESMHGYGIAQHIQLLSLTIEEGSLYPALQRMLVKGWALAEWKTSANNRRVAILPDVRRDHARDEDDVVS